MIIEIHIDEPAVKRLPWNELKELIEKEFEEKQITALRCVKQARREFGLGVSDGTGTEGDEAHE